MRSPNPIIATTVALLVLGAAQAAPGQGADEIAFRSLRSGYGDVYAAPAVGGPAHVVAATSERELESDVSSKGDVVYSAIPPGERQPSLFLRRADGTVSRLTKSGAADRAPAWTGNGQAIVFVRSFPPLGKSQIWRIQHTGGGLQQLTGSANGKADDGLYGSPVWSHPDTAAGGAIFSTDRGGGWPQLASVPPDGGAVSPITTDPNAIHAHPDRFGDAFTTTLVYERCCDASGGGDLYELPQGGSPAPLLAHPAHDEADPSYSPEDTPSRVAYAMAPAGGGDREIWAAPRAGGAAINVSSDPRADLSPAWSDVPPPSSPLVSSGAQTAGGPGHGGSYASRSGDDKRGKKKAGPKKVVEKVVPGVRLLKLRRPGPVRVFALRVNPRKQPTIDVALARGRLKGLQKTKGIARANGAIAAINGDFALGGGRPSHAFADDGDLKQSSFMSGPTFAVSQGTSGVVGDADLTVASVETSSGDVWAVDRWNDGSPVFGEIAGYSAAGAGLDAPAGFECQARLAPAGGRRWGAQQTTLVRDYTVQERGCYSWPLPASGDEVVLTAWSASPEAFLLRTLQPGEVLSLAWTFGWAGVSEGIGGYPRLVAGRAIAVGKCAESLCKRHPRTGIGVTRKGKILMVVVDGRQKGWSKGMTLVRFAKEMKKLGAADAMNLDGGGSSTMVIGKKVVNRPSGGRQRAVSSAVLILPGRDPDDAFASRAWAAPSSGRGGPTRSSAFQDPASTGGFLEAVAEGVFGPRALLDRELRGLLRAYLSSRR